MSREKGFAQKIVTNVADYVNAQRESVVKWYQKKLEDLQTQINSLEAKKSSLETALREAFASRLKEIDARDEASKAEALRVADAGRKLDVDISTFEEAKKSWYERAVELQDDTQALIDKNNSILSAMRDQKVALDLLDTDLKTREAMLKADREDLNDLIQAHQDAVRAFDATKGSQEAETTRLNALRDELKAEDDAIKVSRATLARQQLEADGTIDRMKKIKKDTDEALENLRIEREQVRAETKTNATTAKELRELNQKLIDLQATLKIWESSLQLIKDDQDKREERLKSLEQNRGN